MLHLVEASDRF